MLGEFVLAVLVTQMDAFNRLLGTAQLNMHQFAWALIPPVALMLLWELGKYIARRAARADGSTRAAEMTPVTPGA
jgi:Ca2+-transporting ATPase